MPRRGGRLRPGPDLWIAYKPSETRIRRALIFEDAGPWCQGKPSATLYRTGATSTGPDPLSPIACAAARERSIITPGRPGPRSLIRTMTLWPLARLVTRAWLPRGRVRWAAVRPYM